MFVNGIVNDDVFTNDFYKHVLFFIRNVLHFNELKIGIKNVNHGISFLVQLKDALYRKKLVRVQDVIGHLGKQGRMYG